jgi:uncharacterized membrane protein YccC
MELEMRLSEHPRARAGIRRAKGVAGLLAFVVIGLLSLRSGLPLPDAGVRALGAGIAAYFVAWGVAVTVWKQLAQGELEQARRRRETRMRSLIGDEPGAGR